MKKIKYSKKSLSNLVFYPYKNTNKYSRGQCCIVAGSHKYPGASILCATSAQKSGAGYTKLFTDKENVKCISINYPSIVVESFSNIHTEYVKKNKPICYVVGPGFIPDDMSNVTLLKNILSNTDAPVVIDGGAISCLKDTKIQRTIHERSLKDFITIITPHTGEALSLHPDFNLSKRCKISQCWRYRTIWHSCRKKHHNLWWTKSYFLYWKREQY